MLIKDNAPKFETTYWTTRRMTPHEHKRLIWPADNWLYNNFAWRMMLLPMLGMIVAVILGLTLNQLLFMLLIPVSFLWPSIVAVKKKMNTSRVNQAIAEGRLIKIDKYGPDRSHLTPWGCLNDALYSRFCELHQYVDEFYIPVPPSYYEMLDRHSDIVNEFLRNPDVLLGCKIIADQEATQLQRSGQTAKIAKLANKIGNDILADEAIRLESYRSAVELDSTTVSQGLDYEISVTTNLEDSAPKR